MISCTYDDINYLVHIQNFPKEDPVIIVINISTKPLDQPTFTPATGHLTPDSPLALWSPSPGCPSPGSGDLARASHRDPLACRTDSQANRQTAKWKCSTSHCPQPESMASHSFVERNVKPQKYQSRSLLADVDNQNAPRHLFHSHQVKALGKKQKANSTKGHVESFAFL